jgi:hypothetical protein
MALTGKHAPSQAAGRYVVWKMPRDTFSVLKNVAVAINDFRLLFHWILPCCGVVERSFCLNFVQVFYEPVQASRLFELLRCFVCQPFIDAHDFRPPIRVRFHIFEDFFAGKHLLESVSFQNDVFPIFSKGRIFADP